MSFSKPFHRCFRPQIKGPNSGYSNWAYIVDREYSQNTEYHTRAFKLLQKDILELFEYIEPADINSKAYSYRIHELLITTCIEIEANFKAIFKEIIYTPLYQSGSKKGTAKLDDEWKISDYKKINKTHHLDGYSVEFPYWKGNKNIRRSFLDWRIGVPLTWYKAYNQSKHDRAKNFELANFNNL